VGFNGAVLSQSMNQTNASNQVSRLGSGVGDRMRVSDIVLGHSEFADDCFYRVCLQLGLECQQGWTRVNQMRRMHISPPVRFHYKLFVSYVSVESKENHIELVSNDTNSFKLELENRTIAVMWPSRFFNSRFELAYYNFYANSRRRIAHHRDCLRPLGVAFRGIALPQWGTDVSLLFNRVARAIGVVERYSSLVGTRYFVARQDTIHSCASVATFCDVDEELREGMVCLLRLLLRILVRLQSMQHIGSSTVSFTDSFGLSVNECDCYAE